MKFRYIRLKVAVHFDDLFYRQFGQASKKNVEAILKVAEGLLSDKESLGTTFKVDALDIQHVRGSKWLPTKWEIPEFSECEKRCHNKINETLVCSDLSKCMVQLECTLNIFAFERSEIIECNHDKVMAFQHDKNEICTFPNFGSKLLPPCEEEVQSCLRQCGKEKKCSTLKSDR